MKSIFSFPTIAFFLFSCFSNLQAQHLNLDGTLALDGYDAVSYFQSKPVLGSKNYQVTYKGVIYRFVSESNQKLFKMNPENYLPAYGGWCAYAMGSSGDKVSVDPETFKIVDGKLYLFYNKFFNNTLKSWNTNEKALKATADKNWNALQKK